jgi:hypothetical protein
VQKTAQKTCLGKQKDVFHFRTGPAAGCSHRRIMVDVRAESMVGGTIFHRQVIQREISRALVLNLLWQSKRCSGTAQDKFALDRAFSLIEGHPSE